ncbi:pre-peptidase C-terminal domain-containing protein [Halomonas denitrificans]|nr:hypothetical protein [Halomonas denitrificans]
MRFLVGFSLGAAALFGGSAAAQPTPEQLEEVIRWQDRRAALPTLDAPPVDGRSGGIVPLFDNPERLHRKDLQSGEVDVVPGSRPPRLRRLIAPSVPGSIERRTMASEPAVPLVETAPAPFLFPYTFPWTSHVKLVMEFPGGARYVCSAATVGSFHLITAGHCIYNHGEGGWADQVYAYAAATDVLDPTFEFDYPYGEARTLTMTTYNGWINNQDLDHDFAILEVDWRLGSRTGWMGRETNVQAASLNYNGYPTEAAYVPFQDRFFQHPGFKTVSGYSTYRIGMNAFVYGGHSGGPVWRYDGTDHYTQGVNSTSDRVGSATATRITNTKFTDIDSIIADDEATSPPDDRAELVEYSFSSGLKGVVQDEVRPGGVLDVTWNTFNVGFLPSGEIDVFFYLSPTQDWGASSIFIDQTSLPGGLGPNVYTWRTNQVSVPPTVPTGFYYLHWYFLADSPEYNYGNNVGLASTDLVLVDPNVCLADFWEANEPTVAPFLNGTAPLQRSLCPGFDTDWFEIGLTEPLSGISLSTGGDAGGDTEFDLLDSSFGFVAASTDIAGNYAGLTIDCQSPLAPDQRIVRVRSGNAQRIDSYWLDAEIQPCHHASDVALVPGIDHPGSVTGNGPYDDWMFFYIETGTMPVDVTVTLHGLGADADLYLRAGSKPTARTWACRPFIGGSTSETCEISTTSPERIDIGVVNWDAGTTDFLVTATMTETPLFEDDFES